jgi:NAD(P)-dependent dehydrogenase (short-subunit alcohol dehydrogenase family)
MNKLTICIITGALLVLSPLANADILQGKPTVLITGGNRGIGLEFVKQFTERGWNVIATARKPEKAEELNALAKKHKSITVEQLDVTDYARIEALAAHYKDQPIDILLNNAGLTPKYNTAFNPLSNIDFDIALQSFKVNAMGPLKMCQAFMDNVVASDQKKIIVISSKAGSISASPKMPMFYSYRGSKAALNMYMYTLSFETPKKNVILTLLSPGMVNTIEGTKIPNAIEKEESVSKMMKIIESLTPQDNGKFLSYEDRSDSLTPQDNGKFLSYEDRSDVGW